MLGVVVGGRPAVGLGVLVLVLYGSLPAYRNLAIETIGADVRQFENQLHTLGYRGFARDDKYTIETADAVKKWQRKLGLPETGTVELGRVVYVADEIRVSTHRIAVGDASQPGQAVLTYTGMKRMVVVVLDAAKRDLAGKDVAVDVELPDNRRVRGAVTDRRTVTGDNGDDDPGKNSAGNPGGQAATKLEVSIAVDTSAVSSDLDGTSVGVVFSRGERRDVLTVPVAALLSLTAGGYGVELVENGRSRTIGVSTGMFAAGRVEVTAPGLTEGMTVGMPS